MVEECCLVLPQIQPRGDVPAGFPFDSLGRCRHLTGWLIVVSTTTGTLTHTSDSPGFNGGVISSALTHPPRC
jgi:hypothetical protein